MIDYRKIADAVDHYKSLGYVYVEVPWIVSLDSMLVTRPVGTRLFSTFAGELVASGEQSFIEIRKELAPGKYQCVTPCFRDEKIHNDLHRQYFLKNELIWVAQANYIPITDMIERVAGDAFKFFKFYGPAKIMDYPLDNAIANKDIMMHGIEIGSYGGRTHNDFVWVYGTGCAEPRLSQAIYTKE